jgi:uncharacterized MAPEG superfamily protein
MTTPLWTLLGFALWTVLLLLGTVGVYRWSRILTGREAISSFKADQVQGTPVYHRAMRAHANCVENLPVYAAIVTVGTLTQTSSPVLDGLALTVIAARIVHSLIHVGFEQTNVVTGVRFSFFFVQIAAMLAMAVIVIRHALG